MNRDDEILRTIRTAFADCCRPEHFTNYTHCEECREHNDVLRAHDLDTLSLDHVGNAGWDPICFISPQGFAYYFPALARLALAPADDEHDAYLPQLLWHLQQDGRSNERWLYCSPQQRAAVVAFLRYAIDTRAELLDSYLAANDALNALDAWTFTPEPNDA
ncbi:MAG: DUF6714 family protein [Cyanobacteriota bacterium]|nr:DUF6714 family protein [Cyanobacteriota bacterium]